MKKTPLQMSLHNSIRHWAQYTPNKVAFANGSNEITYSDLHYKMLKIQRQLSIHLEGRQLRIGIFVSDKVDFIASISAVLAEGHSAVIINQKLNAETAAAMIKDSQCSLLLTDEKLAEHFDLLERGNKLIFTHVALSNTETYGFLKHELSDRYLRFVDDVWGMIYSSGTTGIPKGVIRTDMAMTFELLGWCLELPILENSKNYISRPLYYTGGLVIAIATLLVGGTVLVPDEHSTQSYIALLQRYKTDLVFMIPEELQNLVGEKKLTGRIWPNPKRILTMGAPSSPELKKDIIKYLDAECIESWGNSEGLGTITKPEDALIRPSSIGRPFLTDLMRIVDADNRSVKAFEIGHLSGITDSSFSGYNKQSVQSQKVLVGHEVISDDLGYVDEDGYFHIVGRTVERFLRNGMPVFTSDIEKELLSHPAIKKVKVVALKADSCKQVPVAAVVLAPGHLPSEDELIKQVNGMLIPEYSLDALRIVEEIPKNAAGKVDLTEIKNFFIKIS